MFNLAVLSGRLTADPEMKTTQNGNSVCSFTIAVDRRHKQGEERQADFINIVAWRQNAEFVSKYFSKGSMIGIEGSIQTRKYTDKDGNKRKSWDIVADQVYFAESKHGGENQQAKKNVNVEYEDHQPAETFVQVSDDLPF